MWPRNVGRSQRNQLVSYNVIIIMIMKTVIKRILFVELSIQSLQSVLVKWLHLSDVEQ